MAFYARLQTNARGSWRVALYMRVCPAAAVSTLKARASPRAAARAPAASSLTSVARTCARRTMRRVRARARIVFATAARSRETSHATALIYRIRSERHDPGTPIGRMRSQHGIIGVTDRPDRVGRTPLQRAGRLRQRTATGRERRQTERADHEWPKNSRDGTPRSRRL